MRNQYKKYPQHHEHYPNVTKPLKRKSNCPYTGQRSIVSRAINKLSSYLHHIGRINSPAHH